MIDDALDPFPARFAVRAVGHDCRVLHRDTDLVIEAIRHPTLDLLARRATFIHGAMERVMDVVVVALGAQRRFEFRGRHGWQGHKGVLTVCVGLAPGASRLLTTRITALLR